MIKYTEVAQELWDAGIDITADFHASIDSCKASVLVKLAKKQGYRKSKNANGSTARMYFEALQRQARKVGE